MGAQPKKNSRLFILLGVVLTLLSMTGVYFIANSSSKPSSAKSAEVLVATRQIPAHTVFTSLADAQTWFAPVSVPVNANPPGAFTSSASFVQTELNSGKKATNVAIYPKEVVLPSMFIQLGARGTVTNAFAIPKQDVAISMEASTVDESGGAIQPGDYVDLLASYVPNGTEKAPPKAPAQTQFVLQNIKVVAVGTWTPGSESTASGAQSGSTMMTFQVDHQTALVIQHLKDFPGSWLTSMVLRSAYATGNYHATPITGGWFFSHLRDDFQR